MKRICICLIVLMGILSQLNAQEQLKKSTNIPRPNDAIFKQQVEYKNGSVLKLSCKSILLSTQFHKYLLPLHHEESPIITLHLSRCTCRLL